MRFKSEQELFKAWIRTKSVVIICNIKFGIWKMFFYSSGILKIKIIFLLKDATQDICLTNENVEDYYKLILNSYVFLLW